MKGDIQFKRGRGTATPRAARTPTSTLKSCRIPSMGECEAKPPLLLEAKTAAAAIAQIDWRGTRRQASRAVWGVEVVRRRGSSLVVSRAVLRWCRREVSRAPRASPRHLNEA